MSLLLMKPYRKLTAPAIPQSLPTELGALTALQTLSVIGDNTLPGGNFPTTFTALTKLTNLHIEATGLSNLPDDLFKSLASVTAFELVNNDKMTGVPSSLPSLSLGSL
jgi:Leucine-rich repeat (LRR) protein